MNHGTVRAYRVHGCRCDECSQNHYFWAVGRGKIHPRLPVEPIIGVMTDTQRHLHRAWILQRRKFGVRLHEADKMCVSLGMHPWTVYGDLWFSDTWGKDFGNAA
jgi:hypothetical protein